MKKFKKSHALFKKASQVIPLASQTFSKSYLSYIRGGAPLFVTHGKGAYVWDIDANKYIDLINALGPVILGYQYPAVDFAVQKQLQKGISLSLPAPLEYELAGLLVKHIPCAEMVRFGKNGSDATTGAIRLARAVTGREHVAVCGYHGWHDWYIGSTTMNLGVPKSTQAMTHKFVYNNIVSLEKIFKKYRGKVAAVIMEPMSHEEPKNHFLQKVKQLTHKHGALLIFDEIVTGFRFGLGGAQSYFGVTPDLAAFGKAMANGMPISALVGKRRYMKKVKDIFYSFTFGGEALSLAAAVAVIKVFERKKVVEHIWALGEFLRRGLRHLISEYGLNEIIQIKGKPCNLAAAFVATANYTDLEIKSFLQQEFLQNGVLWYGGHTISYAHSLADMRIVLQVYEKAFHRLRKVMDGKTLRQNLRGKPITNIFKVR